jgi:hypothetical protein
VQQVAQGHGGTGLDNLIANRPKRLYSGRYPPLCVTWPRQDTEGGVRGVSQRFNLLNFSNFSNPMFRPRIVAKQGQGQLGGEAQCNALFCCRLCPACSRFYKAIESKSIHIHMYSICNTLMYMGPTVPKTGQGIHGRERERTRRCMCRK